MTPDKDGWRFWVDRGGTFTDIVARSPSGELASHKLLSENPQHYADAVGEGIAAMLPSGESVAEVRLGTTVATNALLTLGGVKTVLLVTKGHRDLLAIGDQRRTKLFDLKIAPRQQLAWRTLEVSERLNADGEILTPLSTGALGEELRVARDQGAASVAISLMHAYRNPAHEVAVGKLAEACGFGHVVMSHATASVQRYLARTTTTLVDAYLNPVLRDYLQRLQESLRPMGDVQVSVMQSHGGLTRAQNARAKSCLLSGPAGGVIGMVAEARKDQLEKLIGFDMGGTSTDVTVNSARPCIRSSTTINGVEILEPHVDVRTIAAGGGSVLAVHDGRLVAGPESAGADPGPACYRAGGPATITDANVVLGRISAAYFPRQFGPQKNQGIDARAAADAIAVLANKLSAAGRGQTATEQLAEDFIDVAVEQMAAAIRAITFRAGIDPADYCLAVLGGAGGQHACQVAETLGIQKIWVHPLTGILSALGMGLARLRQVETRSLEVPLDDKAALTSAGDELRTTVTRALESEGVTGKLKFEVTAGIRVGRSDAILEVPVEPAASLENRFLRTYRERFALDAPPDAIVLSYLRIAAEAPASEAMHIPAHTAVATGSTKQHRVFLRGEWQNVPLIDRESLSPGATVSGPALVCDNYSTLVLMDDWDLEVRSGGSLLLRLRAGDTQQEDATQRSPRLLEIFNGRFRAIAEEMGQVLEQTAQSVNIRERLDYSCALFNSSGQLIANAPHMPVHLGSMGESVRAVLDLPTCDAWLLNSPYAGGTHLPDMTVIMPWHDETSRRRFFVAARAHHADVGGTTPASIPAKSTHIDEEGALFEPTELIKDGEFRTESITQHLANARWPARDIEQNMADLRAQIAACRAGQDAISATLRRFSLPTVIHYADHVIDNAAEAVSAILQKVTLGAALARMDNGAEIKVVLEKRGDRLAVDFTGSSAQSRDNFNAPAAVTRAALLYVLRCLVGRDIPLNDGCLRNVDLRIPPASIIDPEFPAAVVAGNVETSQIVTDVLLEALGVLSNSQGTMNNLTFGGDGFQYYETIAGGSGAGPGFSGASAVQTHMTNSRMTDPEILEARFPVLLEAYEIRTESGGAGRYRGGDGCIRRIRFLQPAELAIVSGRRSIAPQGLAGGSPGRAGQNRIVRGNGQIENLGSVGESKMAAGDCIEISTPGGGGFGER